MTTFVYTWNATFLATPADTDEEAQGAQRIRDTKAAVGERMAVDHSLVGDANDGKHDWVTLRNAGQTTPFTLDVGDGRLFASQNASNTELFYQDSSGNVIQVTKAGSVTGPVLIPSTTVMVFAQASPPAGWTLSTSLNDVMLRVVNSAGGGTGGGWTITGATSAPHQLTIAEIPNHDHGLTGADVLTNVGAGGNEAGVGGSTILGVTFSAQGGNLAHAHGLTFDGTWRPAYVNVILASKN